MATHSLTLFFENKFLDSESRSFKNTNYSIFEEVVLRKSPESLVILQYLKLSNLWNQ